MRFLEDERIAVLRSLGILDTSPEAIFDDLAQLAAQTWSVPIAAVSLVDEDRQWFKAAVGLDVCETGRDVAFCDHAIRSDEVMVVLDATKDARFRDNAFVTGDASIRFYAGAPLRHASGARLGTLCVIDTVARESFDAANCAQLALMAKSVVSALALRREATMLKSIDLERTREQHHLAQAERLAGVGRWSWEPKGAGLRWSPSVFAIHGLAPGGVPPGLDEAIGFYHPEDRPRVAAALSEAMEHGAPFAFQLRLHRADGALRHVKAHGDPQRDATGAIVGVAGVFMDVTDVVSADEALRTNAARLQFLTENAADVILRVAPGRGVVWASPNVRRYGHEPEVLLGKTAFVFLHPDDLEMFRSVETARLTGRELPDGRNRFRFRGGDGAFVWFESSASLVRDDAGEVVEMVLVLRDVTLQQEAESALAASESRHRMLAHNVTDIIACFDTNGRFTYLSPSIRTVLGYEPEELVGQSTAAIMHADDHARSLEVYRRHLTDGEAESAFDFEYRAFRKSGEMVWLSGRPRAVLDHNGRLMGFQDIVRDVSERRRLEGELREARDEAERAADAKARFLANMSHEIRTPLTAVLGFASLLDETPDLPEPARTYVSRVVGAGNGLLAIVNDVLDFSKLEAGQFTVTPRPTDVSRLCNDTLAIFAAQAAEKDLDLLCDAGSLPPCLLVDPDRLRQALINLIGNAVKFTEVGQVSLTVAWVEDRLRLCVADTGAGMDAADQAALFKRFSQVGGDLNARQKGTGLGLAITRGLIEAMGGAISLRSCLGEGSVFSLDLPAPEAAPDVLAATQRAPSLIDGARILVVDDNDANLYLTANILATVGAEVSTASGGASALSLLETTPFDVILLDRRMPDLDGPGVLARLRNSDGPNGCIPVLMFTADPFADLQGAGWDFQGVVRKPIDAAAMFTAVEAALNVFSQPEDAYAAAS